MTIAAHLETTSPDRAYGVAVTDAIVERTAEALRARGFDVHVADDREQAKDVVLGLVPAGSEVHGGASKTLEELGVRAEVEESGRYDALRPRLRSMDRATQMREMRQLGSAPDIFVNSANAVTEDGRIVLASFGGSQLGPIASGAGRVILAIGAQKIVPDLDSALGRIENYCFPDEDARLYASYGMHSAINKVLVINGDLPGRTSVVLIKDVVGV
jgi:acyl-CoA hydrolase